jgi:hypothetical protein
MAGWLAASQAPTSSEGQGPARVAAVAAPPHSVPLLSAMALAGAIHRLQPGLITPWAHRAHRVARFHRGRTVARGARGTATTTSAGESATFTGPGGSRGTFGQQAQSAPRYMGIPTFMRAPLCSVEDAVRGDGGHGSGGRGLDVAMLGVPFDGGVTNRPGARHGPREVRVQSANMRGIHRIHGFSPFEVARCVRLSHSFGHHGDCGGGSEEANQQ